MAKTTDTIAPDGELAARAAWLHFIGGLTQSEVAGRLGISTSRAHRTIAKAQQLGLVHITVDAEAASCIALEDALIARYGLSMCRVAMDLGEPAGIPLRALGALGSDWLASTIAADQHEMVGISHGRTIAAAVEVMPAMRGSKTAFVSLLGGLTRSLAANPYDVIHRLARKTDGGAYLMPAPIYADTAADRDVLFSQSIIADVIGMMRSATLAVVGIGDLPGSTGLMSSVENVKEAFGTLYAAGARAELLGQFIDGDGRIMETEFDGRVMALPLEDMRGREVVAIAGGQEKTDAIRAVLMSGLLTGLIIDEATARCLAETPGGRSAAAA